VTENRGNLCRRTPISLQKPTYAFHGVIPSSSPSRRAHAFARACGSLYETSVATLAGATGNPTHHRPQNMSRTPRQGLLPSGASVEAAKATCLPDRGQSFNTTWADHQHLPAPRQGSNQPNMDPSRHCKSPIIHPACRRSLRAGASAHGSRPQGPLVKCAKADTASLPLRGRTARVAPRLELHAPMSQGAGALLPSRLRCLPR